MRRLALALAIGVAAVQLLAVPSAGAAVPLVPAANIAAAPAYPGSCQSSPRASACQNAAIAALNHARAVLGARSYRLPASFASLPTATQLLVLSNDDRALYGRTALRGLNATLGRAAQTGVQRDADPAGPGTVDGVGFRGWASNWAAGYASPLYSYYEWMYNDGAGGTNIDCHRAGDRGCWGHRLNTLSDFGSGTQVAMGVGTGTSPSYRAPAFTELYEAFAATGAVTYVPAVTGVGPSGVAQTVAVSGFGFVGVKTVTIGSTTVRFTVLSSTSLRATFHRGSGPVAVRITSTGGTSSVFMFAGLPAG